MHFLKQHAFFFYYVANIFCSDGYIMPVCSENGGVCLDKTANGECTNQLNLKLTNVSELFSFVTRTVEITKRWMYDQVFAVCHLFYKEPEEPPKQISYIEAVWTFLGFQEEPKPVEDEYTSYTVEITKRWMYDQVFAVCHLFYKEPEEPPKQISYIEAVWTFLGFQEEPKPVEDEYTSCNPYVFGAILTFYFGYVLMATKCFAARKSTRMSTEEKPSRIFLPFLAKENGLCEEDLEESDEDESTVVFQPKCAECNHSNLSSYLTGDDDEQ